ncbi:signal peptidase I [Pseudoxanthomonas wuyuanensis]
MTGLRRWIAKGLWVAVIVVPLALLAAYLINPFGVRSADPRQRIIGHGLYRVPSSSMMPGIAPGHVLVTRAGYYVKRLPQRGDVVTLLVPGYDGQVWMQRIVGLPGETVAIEAGKVHVDGRPLNEPYVSPDNALTDYARTMSAMTIPAGHYFMLGDNRDNSMDSRMLEPARREDITGKVIARLY